MTTNELVTLDDLATANSSGGATITFKPRAGQFWHVLHIGIVTDSLADSSCQVQKNGKFICGSDSGNLDSADGAPVPLKDSEELEIVWIGLTAGSVAHALIIYELSAA